MLTCAMCGRPLRKCCDLFYEAQNAKGRKCVICGDCAEELEAYAQEVCKGQKCPEQKEDKS